MHFPNNYNWSLMHNATKGIIPIKKINSFNTRKNNKWVYCQGMNPPWDNTVTREFPAPDPAAFPPGTQLPKEQPPSWLTCTELQTRCRATAFSTSILHQTGTNWSHVRHGILRLGCSTWDMICTWYAHLLQPAITFSEGPKTSKAIITFEYKPKTSQSQLSHSYETMINSNL